MLNNLATDEEPMVLHLPAFTGQVSAIKPSLIGDDEASWLVNGVVDAEQRFTNRPAFRNEGGTLEGGAPIHGAHFYDTPAMETVICNINNKLNLLSDSGSVTPLSHADYTTNGPCFWAQIVDLAYWCDGRPNVFYEYFDGGSWQHGRIDQFSDSNPLPNISYLCASKSRILFLKESTDILYCSSILNPSSGDDAAVTFGSMDGIRVGNGDGDPGVCLQPWSGNWVAVFKEGSEWLVDADPNVAFANWYKEEIGPHGIVGPLAKCRVGNDIWFLAKDGVHTISRSISGDPALGDSLTLPIQDIIDRLNPAALSKSWMQYHDRWVLLGVPLDMATEPNIILCYDLRFNKWCGYWEQEATGLFRTFFQGDKEAYSYRNDGELRKLDAKKTQDKLGDGSEPHFQTDVYLKSLNYGSGVRSFDAFRIEVELRESTARMGLWLYRDGERIKTGEHEQFPPILVEENVYTSKLPTFPWVFPIRFTWNTSFRKSWLLLGMGLDDVREIMPKLTFNQGRFHLRELIFSGFANTTDLEIK